jgi:guanylate kinase
MILDVDVRGAFKLKKRYPEAIMIFVLPPSIRELKRRLTRRGTETAAQLKVRFDNAIQEMRLFNKFDYAVINQDLEKAVKQVLAIIESHPCRVDRMTAEHIKRLGV